MTKITFLESIYKPTEVKTITLNQALLRIIKGNSKEKVNRYVKTGEEKIKKSLPAVLFNGEFSAAFNKDLVKGSGCAILDFDDVEQIGKLQDSLAKVGYIICSWVSVSGKGVKALARIPEVSNNSEYRAIIGALTNDLSSLGVSDLDESKDVRRLCFESSDPDLRAYRKFADAEVFKGKLEESKSVHLQADEEERISRDEKLYRQALSMLGGQRNFFVEGNRNNFVYKLAAVCCNYGAKESAITGFIIADFGSEMLGAIASAFKAERYTKWEFPFIMVGDNYFEVKNLDLVPRKRQTLVDRYGGPFLRKLPYYEDMTILPNNTESWQDVVGNKYNLYTPFAHASKKGGFGTVVQLMEHVFGDQYELGLDYMQLLYLKPRQMLPVLCLVSVENQTGKSTFLDFLMMMFVNNVSVLSVEEFERQFNGFYATKLIIGLDESETSDKKKVTNKIKQLSTQKHVFIENKFQSVIKLPFYGKIVMASNQEKNFAYVNNNDIRYWVRKLGRVESFDPRFYDKLKAEIPAFCHYLKTREMSVSSARSRMWFSPEDLMTSALGDVMKHNRHPVIVELEEWLEDQFELFPDLGVICMSGKDIKEKILYHYNGRLPSTKLLNSMIEDEWKIEKSRGRYQKYIGGGTKPTYANGEGMYFVFLRQLLDNQGK